MLNSHTEKVCADNKIDKRDFNAIIWDKNNQKMQFVNRIVGLKNFDDFKFLMQVKQNLNNNDYDQIE